MNEWKQLRKRMERVIGIHKLERWHYEYDRSLAFGADPAHAREWADSAIRAEFDRHIVGPHV